MIPPPPRSTLFPYTTLFRSVYTLHQKNFHPRLQNINGPHQDLPQCQGQLSVLPLPYSIPTGRSEEHTSELQSQSNLVCRLLLEKKKTNTPRYIPQEQHNTIR